MKKVLLLVGIVFLIGCGPSAAEKEAERLSKRFPTATRIKLIEETHLQWQTYQLISVDGQKFIVLYEGGIAPVK